MIRKKGHRKNIKELEKHSNIKKKLSIVDNKDTHYVMLEYLDNNNLNRLRFKKYLKRSLISLNFDVYEE